MPVSTRSCLPDTTRAAELPPGIDTSRYLWIVEDDQLVKDAFETHLEALGVSVDFAITRGELLTLAEQSGWPDYVVLDDMLGGDETGLDLANWLADHLPRERIMIVTGNSDPQRLETLNRSPFLVKRKPLDQQELTRWMSD